MDDRLGILEWFRIGEPERVERALEDMKRLGVQRLRTGVSWADWMTPNGGEWYDWLMPRLSGEVEVLPCFHYTPPCQGVEPRVSAPPRDPKAYADFLDVFVDRYDAHFEWVELWNEPNNLTEWDWSLDPGWQIFSAMIGGAAHWMRQRGKKTVLGGMSPIDPNWIAHMASCGVLKNIDVVGVHGFPGAYSERWEGWDAEIGKIRRVLDERGLNAEIWITETGHSTWRNDGLGQIAALLRALDAPAERVYWYGLTDLRPELASQDGFHVDERDYHFGLRTADGAPKTLFRLWSDGGLPAVREIGAMTPHVAGTEPLTLITGGAGFVGTNLADRELREGRRVLVFDNLARAGVEHNLRWLKKEHGDRVGVIVGDVRDRFALRQAVTDADRVVHLAAQVAVTTSVDAPVDDFEINAKGTLNLLEELRRLETPPPLLFTSTNKVYGDLADVPLRLRGDRYEPEHILTRSAGIGEDRPLDFHSPYGCSKGTADQYVLDYARTYDLPTVVFRMSCIYGPHQFGNEDQGWVAHFLIRALSGEPITLYGDGKQVRDVLFVEDLVEAMQLALDRIASVRAHAFNVGGGPRSTTSLLELLALIERITGEAPKVSFADWRVGDQRYYVSDPSRLEEATGWQRQVDVEDGVRRLALWLAEESPLLKGKAKEVRDRVRSATLR